MPIDYFTKKPSGNPFKNKQEYFVENICENMFPKIVLKRKLNNRKNLNILLPSALQMSAWLCSVLRTAKVLGFSVLCSDCTDGLVLV